MNYAVKQTNFFKRVVCLFLLFFLLALFFKLPVSFAAETSFTSGADWNAGTKTNTTTAISEGDMQLQASGSWGARNWRTPDLAINVGSTFVSDGTNIYVARGVGDTTFWKYTPATDTWHELASTPRGVYAGGDLEIVGEYVYLLAGGYQKTFARYSISANTWETLANIPDLVYSGGSLTTDGTDLYAVRGNNTQDFYKYTASSNSWASLAAPPATIGAGADLVRVGDYIYTPRGISTATFYRYSISANSWSALTNVPATMTEMVDITTDGTDLFVTRQGNTNTFYTYTIATGTWSTKTALPGLSRYGGAIYHSGDAYVYIFQGNGTYNFWKYNTTNDTYLGTQDAPATLSTGSDSIYYNGDLYVTRGANTTTFYKYTTASNTWSTLSTAPANFNDDTKGIVAGSYIYFFQGSNTSNFYRYDPAENSWTTMATTPAAVRFGASLAYPGSGDYIYGTRGATTLSFWRYSISSNSWDDVAVTDMPTDAEASYGSRMVSDGTDVYYLAGTGISRWFKYSVADNTWSELARSPFAPYYGTDIAFHNGKVIALAGWYKTDVWEYTIASDSWRKLEPLPGYLAQNVGPWAGASIEYDDNGSFYIFRGNSLTSILNYTPSAENFVSSGTWISEPRNLGFVASWTSLSSEQTTPSDSSISFQTRTSTDGSNWSDWETVTGGTIISPAQTYIQVKAILLAASGSNNTPVLSSISISYVGDTIDPSNPNTTVGSSQEVGGTALTSGESYTHVNPYFSWSGAADEQTSVAGYYVYFGTNNLADPEIVGEYQTASTYLATKPFSTGTYYLRIKTKDSAGNISDATTTFIYNYTGISPAQSLLVGTTAEFTGSTTNTSVANDQIKLASRSSGFWVEETLTNAPAGLQYGAKNVAYVESSGKLYLFQGANNTTFYSYDIATDTWTTLTSAPATVHIGGGVVEGPEGYLYAMRGNNTTSFWRYSIEDNTWSDESAADAPLTAYYGTAMVYDGQQFIYVMRGNNDDAFWRYNTADDTWENLSNTDFGATNEAISNLSYISADLTIDTTNELIYATQGNLLDGFSVYNMNTNAWTVLPDLPSLPYLGSSIEYVPETNTVYYMPGYSIDKMFKYDVGAQAWTQVASSPYGFYYGGSLKLVGEYLFGFIGNNSTSVYKYNLNKDSWMIPNRGLFSREYLGTSYLNANYGADILKGDEDNFYILRGNFSDEFIKWNSATGTSTPLATAPVGTYTGSSLVYDSTANKIYLTGGIYVQKFYVYDIATNVWSEETSDPPPINTDYGTSMVYDGSRYIYMNRGGTGTQFYRFDTQGSSGTKWSALTASPAGLGYGAELARDGNYLYTLRGQNVANNPFYRYDITANAWSDPAVADLTTTVYNDGFLTNGGDGYLYAARGGNFFDFFKYSIIENTWTTLPNSPARISAGGSAESNGTNKIFMLTGGGTNSFQDSIYTYIQSTPTSAFEEEGTYTSQTHDLSSVYKWANLVVEYESASNTNLSIQTRSSSDATNWSSWTAVAATKQLGTTYTYQIKSPSARYIEVKFTLTSSDGIYSGVIDSYAINYFSDTTAPSNPLTPGFSAYSNNEPGSTIVTNTWYSHTAPYFDWPDAEITNGASDTSSGSGVSGYYVYFGTNAAADPFEDGELQTESDYTASGLVSGSNYYLLIKTTDDAGNIAAESWNPFIYKYDGEAPSAPANLVSDPSGYSAIDSFDFSWDTATTSGAPVSSYCYKTGAQSGEYATDQCISETEINNIPSHRVGVNTFSVRTKDAAGNYSSYSTVTYFYVNSDNAPAPPVNLTVTPSSNTANSFAFSWDPPATGTYFGSAANLSYYYSINALPSASTTTATSVRNLIAGAYATVPGENVFYIVSKDEAGNINYSNYAQTTFTANTSAPGIPLNIDIADVSVKSTSSWKIALSWEAPSDTGSGVSTYSIYRSTDGVNFTNRATSGGISFVDTGLTQQTYYYKVKACDSTNNCGAFSEIVSLYPDGKFIVPADLVSDPVVSSITTKKAVVSWTTARTADSKIAFGTSSGEYFDEEVANSEQVTSHSLTLSNLAPGTTYYYIAKWTDEDGNTGSSSELSFSTEPPPTTEEATVKSVGLDFALLEFTSQNAARIRVYYGESSAFGGITDIVTGTGKGTHTVQLTNLTDGIKYYYKINSFDSEGEEYEGEIHSFETLPRPKISNIKINQVKGTAQSTLLVSWESNTSVSSIVTYYPISSPASARDEVNIALKKGKHQMILSNLEPQTTYAVILKGKDIAGNEAAGEIQQVTTSADTRPPQITDLKVEGEIVGTDEVASAQLLVSFNTDEAATAQIEFGEGSGSTYSQKTQEDGTLTNHHLVVISGLTPGKVYHLRAISKDEFNNKAESIDKVVITPKATENALDLVMTNMSAIFGFLAK